MRGHRLKDIQTLLEDERRMRPGLLNRGKEEEEENEEERAAQDTQMFFGVSCDIRIIKIP